MQPFQPQCQHVESGRCKKCENPTWYNHTTFFTPELKPLELFVDGNEFKQPAFPVKIWGQR